MRALTLALLTVLVACGEDGAVQPPQEVITTVALTFAPTTGSPSTFEFDDPDGDGGAAPIIDPITIGPGNYTLTVVFENRLEMPAEDITVEIADEADQHQVFFTGTAVDGPAADNPGAPLAHRYDDTDRDGNPIGLTNTITATPGAGELVVTLRHLPPVNDTAVKVADLADQVKTGGINSIAGDSDVDVTFMVTVQ